jgi:hypothetical protein
LRAPLRGRRFRWHRVPPTRPPMSVSRLTLGLAHGTSVHARSDNPGSAPLVQASAAGSPVSGPLRASTTAGVTQL